MHSDWHSQQGGQHRINQDFVLTDNESVIVCDGCSMAPNSDIGARLLALSAKKILANEAVNNESLTAIIQSAKNVALEMQLPFSCLAATLLIIKTKPRFQVVMCGDGFVAYKHNNKLKAIQVHYPSGAPFYPYYQNPDQYIAQFGNEVHYIDYDFEDNSKSIHESNSDSSSFQLDIPENSEWVGLFTDGVESFIKTVTTDSGLTHEHIGAEEILIDLTDFKNYNGEFVHRRGVFAFKKFRKLQWENYDDCSFGILKL